MSVLLINRVENIAAKGEIACFEQFPLLPQCFQKSSAADASTWEERFKIWHFPSQVIIKS